MAFERIADELVAGRLEASEPPLEVACRELAEQVCAFPLGRLDDALADCGDGKTLVALLLLERLRRQRVVG